jgi:hypothetical protein
MLWAIRTTVPCGLAAERELGVVRGMIVWEHAKTDLRKLYLRPPPKLHLALITGAFFEPGQPLPDRSFALSKLLPNLLVRPSRGTQF